MPWQLQAFAGRYVMLAPRHPGNSARGPDGLPERTDVDHLIAAGDVEQLGFVPSFMPYQSGKFGDLLWVGGLPIHIASNRLIDVLTSIGATGFHTCPVQIHTRRHGAVPGYQGLRIHGSNSGDDLYFRDGPTYAFRVADRVRDALRTAGVTALRCRDVARVEKELARARADWARSARQPALDATATAGQEIQRGRRPFSDTDPFSGSVPPTEQEVIDHATAVHRALTRQPTGPLGPEGDAMVALARQQWALRYRP